MTSRAKGKKKNFPKSTSEMSKEMLMETLKKKKECNARALKIVETLCESSPDENWLLANLAFINQTHFEDVIVERAISKICGYPLCSAALENVPSKKYHISTRYNKVYDLTERKNFCSNVCYKAGMYVKDQLLTSPLWFRDKETIPQFQLLHSTSSSMGEEVVFLPEREQLKRDIEQEQEEERHRAEEIEKLNEKLKNLNVEAEDRKTVEEEVRESAKKSTNSEDRGKEERIAESLHEISQNPAESNSKKRVDGGNSERPETARDETAKTGKKSEDVAESEKGKGKETKVAPDPVRRVEQCVHEWFTFDTVLYLYGEGKVREMLKDRKEELTEAIRAKPLVAGFNERMDRLINLYAMLDRDSTDSFDPVGKKLKPLPDYSVIREDGRKIDIKVRAFYKGQLEMSDAETTEKGGDEKETAEDGQSQPLYLPLVDAHAQKTLRTKILLDRLNRIVPDVIGSFARTNCCVTSELRNLVSSFALSARNITFRPREWYLLGFIVAKLLSVKNKQLEYLLKSEHGTKHVSLFLISYGLPEDYLQNVLDWLMCEDDLIRKLKSAEISP